MSGREWQPGDVAMVTWNERGAKRVMMRSAKGWWFEPTGRFSDEHVKNARPLVVLDPEDREQVERLAAAYAALGSGFAELMDEPWSMPAMRLRQALREFADLKPPKPTEPTGLGAVVEESDGLRWIRCRINEGVAQWRSWPTGMWKAYNELDAVRVLSEGVTS